MTTSPPRDEQHRQADQSPVKTSTTETAHLPASTVQAAINGHDRDAHPQHPTATEDSQRHDDQEHDDRTKDDDAHSLSDPSSTRPVSLDTLNSGSMDSTVDTDGKSRDAQRSEPGQNDDVTSSATLSNAVDTSPDGLAGFDSRRVDGLVVRPGVRVVEQGWSQALAVGNVPSEAVENGQAVADRPSKAPHTPVNHRRAERLFRLDTDGEREDRGILRTMTDTCIFPSEHDHIAWAAAVKAYDVETMGRMLDQGYPPDKILVQLHFSHRTALSLLAQSENPSIIQRLIDHGATVDHRDAMSLTPLMQACFFGQKSTVDVLIAHGADVNAYSQTHWTPLHWAARQGHASIVQTLLDAGADERCSDHQGATPLMMAMSGTVVQHTAVAQVILQHEQAPLRQALSDTLIGLPSGTMSARAGRERPRL